MRVRPVYLSVLAAIVIATVVIVAMMRSMPPQPRWPGVILVSQDGQRRAYVYDFLQGGAPSTKAAAATSRKLVVITDEAGHALKSFTAADLSGDLVTAQRLGAKVQGVHAS